MDHSQLLRWRFGHKEAQYDHAGFPPIVPTTTPAIGVACTAVQTALARTQQKALVSGKDACIRLPEVMPPDAWKSWGHKKKEK
jgi:hypothetical protein